MPKATPFCAIVWLADCAERGMEMAHWLFWTIVTTGAFQTAAKFRPSWKSPSLVPPSPMKQTATASSFRWRLANARPTACGIWQPITTLIGMMRRAGSGRMLPSSQPL